MTQTMTLGLMGAATVLAVLFLLMLLTSGKFQPLLDAAGGKYIFLAGVGFKAMELVHFSSSSGRARQKIRQYGNIYGEKFGEFYYNVTVAKQISAAWLVLIVGIVLAVLAEQPLVLGIAALGAFYAAYYMQKSVKEQNEARKDKIETEYPEVLSKLALLVNAGLITRQAWEKIAFMSDGVLYREMRTAVEDMQNGKSEAEAYLSFAQRCGNDNVTRFISALNQNLNKGDDELCLYLNQYSGEAWNLRKQNALQKGQQASTKLLLPIVLIFGGIMMMVVVPVFAGLGL